MTKRKAESREPGAWPADLRCRAAMRSSAFRFPLSAFSLRPGYTMAELMIVVIIMIMLVAVTLPIAKKVMDDSHVREASRQLNAYFAMTKARAIHTGRPCGLFFECEPPSWVTGSNNAWPVRMVTQMHMAETPAPYAGSTTGALGKITDNPNLVAGKLFVAVDALGQVDQAEMTVLQSILTLNEKFSVRFDYKGNWYPCMYTANGCTLVLPNPVPAGYVFPHGYGNASARGARFQILRSPNKVGNSLAMPTGTCIDLTYSGNGPNISGFQGYVPNYDKMAVMFTPNGGVDRLYFAKDPPNPASDFGEPPNALYFLVGKVDRVNDPTATPMYDIRDSNAADPTSLWVTVGRGNGQVTTSENVPPPVNLATATLTDVTIFPGEPQVQSGGRRQNLNLTIDTHRGIYLRYCREIASSREQMKGR